MKRTNLLNALAVGACGALICGLPNVVAAADFTHYFSNGGRANARMTLSYGLQMRTKSPAGPAMGSADSAGDTNFNAGNITSNNIQALLQTSLSKGLSGAVFSATDFYDFIYRQHRFPKYTRYYNGSYARVLDAYGYTSIDTGSGTLLTLKLGNQVVNWGKMNFFPDTALAQGPVDAVKSNMPGAQTQAILLPERQLSASFSVNDKLQLLADYQFGFHPTQLAGVGSFFSTSNFSGPNAFPPFPHDYAGNPSRNVSDFGQYGLGANYQLTSATTVGVYYLHFDDRTTLPDFVTREMVNLQNEDLVGLTTSTLLVLPQWVPGWVGSISAATETTYRWKGTVLKTKLGVPSYGHYVTSGVDLLDNFGNTPLAPQTTMVFEVSGQYLSGAGPTSTLTYETHTAGALHANVSLGYPGILPGWQLTIPVNYAYQFDGRALFGPTTGGVHSGVFSVGAAAQWHNNLTYEVSYQGYTGGVDGRAPSAHPDADRDFLAFTVTYTF